jgi:putative ABC transport system permease protein
MADSFDFPLATEVWTPNVLTPEDRASRRLNKLNGLARLKPRYTLAQAATELDGLGTHLEVIYPDTNKNRRFMLREAHRFFVNYQREQYLLMLLGSVLFVLLIACVNVANLQFARATGRLREMGIRVALGASRKQIIRQLVTESVLLSVPSAALGLLVADWGMNLIKAGMPPELVRFVHGWKEIQLDERVLIATLIAALLSSFLAGLVPAWQCSRPNVIDALREGGRSGSAGHSRNLLRNLLVTAEIIFAVVLLVGAGLMVRGFRAQVDSGARLEPATLLTMRLAMTDHQSREPHQIANFYREVLDRISGLPGINSIAAVTALPYSGHSDSGVFTIEGRQREPNNLPRSMRQVVSPSYFDTLHIPLQDGRLLLSSDGPDAPKVALISERLAARWWQGQSPLGQHIQVGEPDPKSPWYTIVGVVGDLMHSPYDREPRPAIYLSYQQAPTPWMDISVRTAGDPMLMVPQITSAIHQVDPEQPVTDIRSMEQAIRNSAIGLNYMAVLMGVFGLLALALSALGVYGVMAYLVSEQTREIGIRMALGAQRQNVLSLILRRGLRPVAAGLILGLPLAWGFSHLLASVIYGVAANDIATFVGVPSSLILAALLAVYFPAWRATKIDPIVALRYE